MHALFAVSTYFYAVAVLNDDDSLVEGYIAYNSPLDSQVVVPARQGVGRRELRRFARATAHEMLADHNAPDAPAPVYEVSLQEFDNRTAWYDTPHGWEVTSLAAHYRTFLH